MHREAMGRLRLDSRLVFEVKAVDRNDVRQIESVPQDHVRMAAQMLNRKTQKVA